MLAQAGDQDSPHVQTDAGESDRAAAGATSPAS